jgi:hypothetical protein
MEEPGKTGLEQRFKDLLAADLCFSDDYQGYRKKYEELCRTPTHEEYHGYQPEGAAPRMIDDPRIVLAFDVETLRRKLRARMMVHDFTPEEAEQKIP